MSKRYVIEKRYEMGWLPIVSDTSKKQIVTLFEQYLLSEPIQYDRVGLMAYYPNGPEAVRIFDKKLKKFLK